jgi:hypothetical protein
MSDPAQDVLAKLRQNADAVSRDGARPQERRGSSDDALDPPRSGPVDNTGETVFAAHSLRFRSLTVAEADLSALETPEGFHSGFKIRVAKLGTRREAGKLVERRYAGRGYTIPTKSQDATVLTFIAYDEGQLVGTVGVRLDSEKGLSADDLYRSEIDALRSAGARICEFTRLAVDKNVASRPVLAGLFHTAYLYASVIRNYTHAVIEVNPRHVAYYGRALQFHAIGEERMNRRVDAPAVLLCAPFTTIAEGITKYAGKPGAPGAKHSLFLYGFPPDEEPGVLNRLRQLVAAT